MEDLPATDVLPKQEPKCQKRTMSCLDYDPIMASADGSQPEGQAKKPPFLRPQNVQDHISYHTLVLRLSSSLDCKFVEARNCVCLAHQYT